MKKVLKYLLDAVKEIIRSFTNNYQTPRNLVRYLKKTEKEPNRIKLNNAMSS